SPSGNTRKSMCSMMRRRQARRRRRVSVEPGAEEIDWISCLEVIPGDRDRAGCLLIGLVDPLDKFPPSLFQLTKHASDRRNVSLEQFSFQGRDPLIDGGLLFLHSLQVVIPLVST